MTSHPCDRLSEDDSPAGSPVVVLVRPRDEGNVGAVARAMANMGLERLILVEPAPELGGVARGFGVGGWHVLDAVERRSSLKTALEPFHAAVGTTSGRHRSTRRHRIVVAHDLASALPAGDVALVFGPEDKGLERRELELCDPLVTIACAAEHPTLNLAQAVLLVAYELRRAHELKCSPTATDVPEGVETLARVGEREALVERSVPLLTHLGFDQAHLQDNMVRDLRSLLSMVCAQDPHSSAQRLGLLRLLVERSRKALGVAETPGVNAEAVISSTDSQRPLT